MTSDLHTTATVAIPSYKRPDYLRRAAWSVLNQSCKPNELLIIYRADDKPTLEVIHQIVQEFTGATKIRAIPVVEPGFLPPVRLAVANATCEIFVLMDDDAEAHESWLQRILDGYIDLTIGGVGGRCINYFHGVLQHYPPVHEVGKLKWYGKAIGNMYCECAFDEPREVDFLMGGNMSYRTALLMECLPDSRIGNNVAFHWEMDVGLQVKARGRRIMFDPMIVVDHHSAPREVQGMRTVNREAMYWSNFNYALLMKKHLSSAGLIAYVLRSALVGGGSAPGIAYLLYCFLKGQRISWMESIIPSMRGRLNGLRS